MEYLVEGGAVRVDLKNPVLGENSLVSVYLDGPIPSSLSTEPRADSAREIFSNRGFQHYQIRYRGAVGDVHWRWDTPAGSVTIRSSSAFPQNLTTAVTSSQSEKRWSASRPHSLLPQPGLPPEPSAARLSTTRRQTLSGCTWSAGTAWTCRGPSVDCFPACDAKSSLM